MNQEIREKLDLELAIGKRRLNFYGQMVRMDQKKLNKQIFDQIRRYKGLTQFVNEVKDLERLGIKDHDR